MAVSMPLESAMTAATAEGSEVLLSLKGLTKRFGGTNALNSVDLDIRAGELHALLGENGAGKSTLIKVLAGVYKPDGGEIFWRGSAVSPGKDKLPITFIHQDLGLVDTMTVSENVALAAGYPRRYGLISWRSAQDMAAVLLERMGGGVDPDTRVGDLSAAGKSIVAIARALAVKCNVLVLDEPTAALPEADVERLHAVLHRLKTEGIGIVYVTHRLDEVLRIAERVTVLRDGRRVAGMMVRDTSMSGMVEAIIGRKLDAMFVRPPEPSTTPIMRVADLVTRQIGPVSFDLAPGEILGLVGLRGAGHDTVGRAIFGDIPISAGRIEIEGDVYAPRSPGDAASAKVGFVSSKRREESIAPTLTVRENLYMNPTVMGFGVWQPLMPSSERERCTDVLQRLSVRPANTEAPIATLSGGNQQKVVVSRWIEAGCRVLILEEPTLGVDVGSKAQIYQLLQASSEAKRATLLVSSDFEEVAGVCHRALIFDRGRVVAELGRDELSISRLTALSSGAAEKKEHSHEHA
jgi:ribose transport system ATP-binding protein